MLAIPIRLSTLCLKTPPGRTLRSEMHAPLRQGFGVACWRSSSETNEEAAWPPASTSETKAQLIAAKGSLTVGASLVPKPWPAAPIAACQRLLAYRGTSLKRKRPPPLGTP